MAELDYAFLADLVQVANGRLTAVGASFTLVEAPTFPAALSFGVGMRIRAGEDEAPVPLTISVSGAGDAYGLRLDTSVRRDAAARPYDGKVALLAAAMLSIPLPTAGLYVVELELDGRPVRRLAFEAEAAIPSWGSTTG